MRTVWKSIAKADWAHIAAAAVLLALLTYVFHHYTHALGWLDALAARISAAHTGAVSLTMPSSGNKQSMTDSSPQTIVISRAFYESTFQETSPLDRKTLSSILRALAQRNPRVLVVDIDLSPGTPGSGTRADQDKLDKLLVELAQSIRLIVAAPLPVAQATLRREKLEWMHKLCESKVVFGLTTVVATQGVIVDFDPQEPTIAHLATVAWKDTSGGADEASEARKRTPCEAAAMGIEAADFMAPLPARASRSGEELPIGGSYLAHPSPAIQSIDHIEDIAGGPLTDQAVFLGGAFESRDKHETAFGLRDGVAIQAAIFATSVRPPQALIGWRALLVDIILGILVGAWLYFTSPLLRSAKAWATRYHAYRHWGIPIGTGLQVLADVAVACAFIALVLIPIWAFFSLSGRMLTNGLWLNPAPMIVGLAIDALMNYGYNHAPHQATHHGADRENGD